MKQLLFRVLRLIGLEPKRGVALIEAEYAKVEQTITRLQAGIDHLLDDKTVNLAVIAAKQRELAFIASAHSKAAKVKDRFEALLAD